MDIVYAYTTKRAERLADAAAEYVDKGCLPECPVVIRTDCFINHTVPQRISGKEDCRLSLRVNRPFKDCRIVVRQDGTEVAFKKMKKAIPAEMIQIPLKAEKLSGCKELEVSVEW